MVYKLAKSGTPKYEVIELGAKVCKTLKVTYFADIPWSECHNQVADKFTALKKILRRLYEGKEDKVLLEEISNYSSQDIVDIFTHEIN